MIFLVQFGINKHEKIFQRPLIARARRTFKVSCQDLANRKQNIFRMKTIFISTSWRKQCPIFAIFYKKVLVVQNTELFKAKILFDKYLCQAPHNLANCGVDNKQQCSSERKFSRFTV